MSRKHLLFCFSAIGLLSAFASCKKYPVDEEPPVVIVTPVDSTTLVQFTGLIGVDSIKLYENVNNYFNTQINQRFTATPPDSSSITFNSTLKQTNSNTGIFSVNKSTLLFTGSNPSESDFENFFQPSSLPLATLLSPNGITIEWVDKTGTVWTSNGDQTGSNFNIITSEKRLVSGTALMDVKCLFNCKLYHTSGPMLNISGRFNGSFKNN
ncbi:MAG: hypothetical protein KBB37_01145 [Bacteroidia bacterium]|nr:hypothetical protein [Bacteroidia bacterium]MBP7259864.1 hypothetical protein [Bacteroidia bacterium]MBP9179196.1 hypothetical protein [Bacteroidia bacterium]MBP9723497.1 hypothetical protein [Bacteroidia bacterium]